MPYLRFRNKLPDLLREDLVSQLLLLLGALGRRPVMASHVARVSPRVARRGRTAHGAAGTFHPGVRRAHLSGHAGRGAPGLPVRERHHLGRTRRPGRAAHVGSPGHPHGRAAGLRGSLLGRSHVSWRHPGAHPGGSRPGRPLRAGGVSGRTRGATLPRTGGELWSWRPRGHCADRRTCR